MGRTYNILHATLLWLSSLPLLLLYLSISPHSILLLHLYLYPSLIGVIHAIPLLLFKTAVLCLLSYVLWEMTAVYLHWKLCALDVCLGLMCWGW